jgi:hypothetical protein
MIDVEIVMTGGISWKLELTQAQTTSLLTALKEPGVDWTAVEAGDGTLHIPHAHVILIKEMPRV